MKYSEFNNKKKIRRPEGKAPGNANGQDQIGAVRYGPLFSSNTSMNNLYIHVLLLNSRIQRQFQEKENEFRSKYLYGNFRMENGSKIPCSPKVQNNFHKG